MSAVAAPAFRKASVTLSGRTTFFHSSYEANWARWLDFRQRRGEVRAWVKNTTRFALSNPAEYRTRAKVTVTADSWVPDFLVWTAFGECEVHEVNGWRHNRKAAQMQQFAVDYPGLVVIEITKQTLIALQKTGITSQIPGWEVVR